MGDPTTARERALAGKVIDLEVRLSFYEKGLTDLDEVVRELADRLDSAERRVRDLLDRADASSGADGARGLEEEVPPHY